MKLFSDGYRELLRTKHDRRPWGGTGHEWAPQVAVLVRPLGEGLRVLDYGCGRGTLRPALLALLPDIRVDEYDPGVRGKDVPPLEPVDYVVCTDVLEHVEEDCVDDVLQHIAQLSRRGWFAVVDHEASGSSLPDGRNTHITARPYAWWEPRIRKAMGAFILQMLMSSPAKTVICGQKVG